MVMVLPEKLTWLVSVTAMVRLPPAVRFVMVMLPVPARTASLKVSTILLLAATLVASSAGLRLVSVGAVVSAGVVDPAGRVTFRL